MRFLSPILLATILIVCESSFGQNAFKEWHLKDGTTDTFHGISLAKTYNFLKNKKSKPVIVAVIDSGVDTLHEDLKNVLWHNPGEIPGNGIDDDHNGYIDDVYGWNFLGGKDGRNIKTEATEAARVYHRYKAKFADIKDSTQVAADDRNAYSLWKNACSLLKFKPEDAVELTFMEMLGKNLKKYNKVLTEDMKKDTFSMEQLEVYKPVSTSAQKAKLNYITMMKMTQMESEETNVSIITQFDEFVAQKQKQQDALNNAPENFRQDIVKDNYSDLNDRFYGNNDVMGPGPMHGTHVSGIIAAQRNNDIGTNGVADNVRIMMIRAVPDGDEYDKDVALAIRYAVDNGAKVINMSFGKGISPEKKWVDDAVQYAASKDVLIIHAAGNDAVNVDSTGSFPNPVFAGSNRIADNFITVGACTDPKISNDYVASFSNYGKRSVDVFAPGEKIYSTLPGGNTYGFLKGTSMASPVVAGIAALIRSYYPGLSARQVKTAIESSVVTDTTLRVNLPGTKDSVKLSDLCTTGGFANAYGAIEKAATMEANLSKREQKPSSVAPRRTPLPKAGFKNTTIRQ